MIIKIKDEVIDYYSGQINCESGLYIDEKIVGLVEYILYNRELTISYIFVRPEYRRKGYASMLMDHIIKKNPKYKYKLSLKTELGSKFKRKDPPQFVAESIEDILKPKSKEEILKNLKKAYNYNELNELIFELSTYLETYLKHFSFTKHLWLKDSKWKNNRIIRRSIYGDSNYGDVDVTKEAKLDIIDACKNIKNKKRLKAIQLNFGGMDLLTRFFAKIGLFKNKNSYDKDLSDNKPFKWIYRGEDYAYLGNPDGFALFIVPEDFLENFFDIK